MPTTSQITARWDFDRRNDREGWTVPPALDGRVIGGCLWITPAGKPRAGQPDPPLRITAYNWFPLCLESPPLAVPRRATSKVRLRVLNLSPETDGAVYWRASDDPAVERQAPFTLQPWRRDWQEVVCHLDETPWDGELRSLRLALGMNGTCGNIYVDWIAVTDGPARPRPPRPDIRGGGIPVVDIPGVPQADFQAAYDVLNDAVVWDPLPINGFPYPFLAPGAKGERYGLNWWLLDNGLCLPAIRWTDLGFCEKVMRGLMAVQDQNPDGRIHHEGRVAWRGCPGDSSVIPRYFEQIRLMAAVTADDGLVRQLYESAAKYLNWWLSPVKRDAGTGLVTAYFEETLTDHSFSVPGEIAPVDTNVAVALGCHVCAALARRLGLAEAADGHQRQFAALKNAINTVLWNEEDGCYYNWNVREGRPQKLLASHMFDTLRLGIAPPERSERLLAKLLEPALFQWGGIGLTTLARTDPKFSTNLLGAGAWEGGIWTMRNLAILEGLRDLGRHDLAAELAWMTIRLFTGNYAEYLHPEAGQGVGVKRYCWSAAQYLETIVAHLFGVAYETPTRCLQIFPHVPTALAGATLGLRGLRVTPTALALDLDVCRRSAAEIHLQADVVGEIPAGAVLEVGVAAPPAARQLRIAGVEPAAVQFRPGDPAGWVRLALPRQLRLQCIWDK